MNESHGAEGEDAGHTPRCPRFHVVGRFGICVSAVSK